jgi:FkbM family methyltransferase
MIGVMRALSVYGKIYKTVRRNLEYKKFEPEVQFLPQFVSSGDVCLDVGASYGRYSFVLAKLVGPTGQVHSFEPGRESLKVLSAVKSIQRLKNVRIVEKALSDKEGKTQLIVPIKLNVKNRRGLSLAYISDNKVDNSVTETIEMTTIDAYCRENNLKHVDFMKCDVEGGELQVFKGAEKTIEKYIPTILAEINDDFLKDKFHASAADVYQWITKKGYKSFALKKNRLQEMTDLSENNNYFFVHSSRPSLRKLIAQ